MTTKAKTKEEPCNTKVKPKHNPRNTKIYPVTEVLEKCNLTPDEFREIAQGINNFQNYIKGTEGISHVGYMQVRKVVKKLKLGVKKKADDDKEKVEQAQELAPDVRMLEVCAFKPPNKLRLYCIDEVTVDGNNGTTKVKVTVIVTRKIHDGAKSGSSLRCKHLGGDLFRHIQEDI